MKKFLAPVFAGLLVLLIGPFERSGAQTPFNSTSPPNSNPFGHSDPFAQPVAPATAVPVPGGGMPGYPAPAPTASTQSITPDHKLTRGDHLSFRVQEDRDDKVVPLVVTDSGEVDVPLAGRVNAAGKTTAELASNIKSILEREYYYHATVIMGLDSVAPVVSRGRVYVTGAVRNRGALEMPPGSTLTVSQAITQSGGSSDFGDLKHVRIIRQGSKKLIVNVAAVLKDSPEKDVALEPDDTVFVPEKTFNINF